jgi:hypothetical protein
MGVFLRWGIFGILAVAGLVYAYNASKKLTENRRAPVAQTQGQPGLAPAGPEGAAPVVIPPDCEAERDVAELALAARRDGVTFDRLLRNPQIAFVNDARQRARLANVARRWYDIEGVEPSPEALSATVVDECRKFTPAP